MADQGKHKVDHTDPHGHDHEPIIVLEQIEGATSDFVTTSPDSSFKYYIHHDPFSPEEQSANYFEEDKELFENYHKTDHHHMHVYLETSEVQEHHAHEKHDISETANAPHGILVHERHSEAEKDVLPSTGPSIIGDALIQVDAFLCDDDSQEVLSKPTPAQQDARRKSSVKLIKSEKRESKAKAVEIRGSKAKALEVRESQQRPSVKKDVEAETVDLSNIQAPLMRDASVVRPEKIESLRDLQAKRMQALINEQMPPIQDSKTCVAPETQVEEETIIIDEEANKLEQCYEEMGVDSSKILEQRDTIEGMMIEGTTSDEKLIKVESDHSVNDGEIADTFFDEGQVNEAEKFVNLRGMDTVSQISSMDTDSNELPPSNYTTPTQRCSDATAIKFVIDVSEPDPIPPQKEKKVKKGRTSLKSNRTSLKHPEGGSGRGRKSKLDEDTISVSVSVGTRTSTFSKRLSVKYLDIEDTESGFDEKGTRGPRMSIMRNRASIRPSELTYNFEARHTNVDDAMESWFSYDKSSSEEQTTVFSLPNIPEEKEEEASSVEEEREERLYRDPYYERYSDAMERQQFLKMKNNILQKYIAMHFRRRKTSNFLVDSEPTLEQLNKYHKKLETFGEIQTLEKQQRDAVEKETNTLKERRDKKFLTCVKMFDDFQNHEEVTGTGLIHSKTGKPVPEKTIERYIRRQKSTMNILCRMRLENIKLNTMLSEKNRSLDEIDQIAPGRRLLEYEQLKSENRGLKDRIEEKDEDLVRVRSKCQATIQMLAHLREKSAALEADISTLKEDLEMINMVARNTREAVSFVRQHKDNMRARTAKFKEESGLLTEPILLADMEENTNEVEALSIRMNELQEDVNSRTLEIRNIRKNIQNMRHLKHKEEIQKLRPSFSLSRSVSFDASTYSDKSNARRKSRDQSRISIFSRRTSKKSKVDLIGKPTVQRENTGLFKQNDKVGFDDLVRVKAPSRMYVRKRSTLFTEKSKES